MVAVQSDHVTVMLEDGVAPGLDHDGREFSRYLRKITHANASDVGEGAGVVEVEGNPIGLRRQLPRHVADMRAEASLLIGNAFASLEGVSRAEPCDAEPVAVFEARRVEVDEF